MQEKIKEKNKAIKLRRQGLSYREILEQIPVAKSSLSLWLRGVGLARRQKQRLTAKKLAGMKRGWEARHNNRIKLAAEIKERAKKEIGKLSCRELWLIGVALYWAEGSKEKEYRPGSATQFGNYDPLMIKTYLYWLINIIKQPKEEILFEIYIHENHKHRISEIREQWSRCTGFSKDKFNKVYFKKNKLKTNRKNVGSNYFGLLRIRVKNSSGLNRKIQGWIEGIYNNCGVVQR